MVKLDYKQLRKILNQNASVRHYAGGRVQVSDSRTFKGLSISALQEAQDMVAQDHKEESEAFARKCGITLDTLDTVNQRAVRTIGTVIDSINAGEKVTRETLKQTQIRDSIMNPAWNIGNCVDPTIMNRAFPNVYISPYEANALYSQKGLFETIVNKKSKSILLNGFAIENRHLSQKQMDKVNENAEVKNIKHLFANSTRDSLAYGGNLIFPMFKKDTPLTAGLKLSTLIKLGVVGKNCIDYFISLDRWNTFIIPPYNPTQKDFLNPEVYTIPFLGADVHHTRCGRIVTAPQAGYWGAVINQGWGISDFCGYLQSGMNYKVAMQSLPLMIQQMSILARTINIDGVLATEGSNALDALVEGATIRTREASADNPVTMDVLGDIKSIDRNFGQVPELIRLLRQDVASDATMPEPMLWSSEKGNFSSGDDTQGNLAKQWESVRMIHKDIEPQVKQIAKILIIDALGATEEVMKALPYTQIHFDEPVVANSLERAQIGKFQSENIFNLVSAQMPLDIAVEMASKNVSSDLAPTSDVLDRLRKIQEKVDRQDEIRFENEKEQAEANIEQTEQNTENAKEQMAVQNAVQNAEAGTAQKDPRNPNKGKGNGENTKGRSPAQEEREKALADKEEKGYSRLEQKQKEKTRIGSSKRNEKLAKSKNKRV